MITAFDTLVTLTQMLLGQFLVGFSASPFFQAVPIGLFTFGYFIFIVAINRSLRLFRAVRMVST